MSDPVSHHGPARDGDLRQGAAQPSDPQPGLPSVRVGRGPRAVEAELLAALDGWAARCTREPAVLARPLRVVVPSRSLREHVHAAALAASGRALVGVSVQTLFATALEILERAGEPSTAGRALCEVEVRRALRDEPSLQAPLEGLEDAHRVVAGSVDDLLDAGLSEEHAEPLLEMLGEGDAGELGVGPDAVERACALVRIALRVRSSLGRAGLAHRSQLLERAAEALERDPSLLPVGEIWIHGFAEATGRATDLLLALARAHPAVLLVDEPPEPAGEGGADPGAVFAARLRERFEGLGGPATGLAVGGAATAGEAPENARAPELLAAPGAEAEVRSVAGRIREQLDADPTLAPERIAIVARQLGPYAVALRTHLERLGIPYSGVGATAATGAPARRGAALASLLEHDRDASADRFVELLRAMPGWDGDVSPAADLRLGLRELGAGRLASVAELAEPARDVPLPVRQQLRGGDDEVDAADGPRAPRRRLRRAVVTETIRRAAAWLEGLAAAPRSASAGEWDAWLRRLLAGPLAWTPEECDTAFGRGLSGGLPSDFVLTRAEALVLLRELVRERGASAPIGGAGGGVALLGVMEARARTFDHLYVLGLGRDVFPRPIREDALLPDALRRPMLALLPDLPIKATGLDEERYLFAQLAASSPNVVLSWQAASDDGRERVRSTFVDRLCSRLGEPEIVRLPALHRPEQLALAGRKTARELVLWAGVGGPLVAPDGSPLDWAGALPAALREGGVLGESGDEERANALGLDAERIAGARIATVDEYGRYGAGEAALGPFLGFVGAAARDRDPRRGDRYVTALENMARCPWKMLLERLLRIEAPPDPLESFPELGPLVVGNTVHTTLEALLRPGGEAEAERDPAARRSLEALLDEAAVQVAWPGSEAIERAARECARAQLEEQGHPYPGLVEVLAERVVTHVERARELFGAPAVAVLGAEVGGRLAVADGGEQHEVAFRADLVERVGDAVRLTDYKTGKPHTSGKKADTRLAELERKVARGEALQAVAYALAAGGDGAVGRYLFVDPKHDPVHAAPGFEAGSEADAGLEAAFRSAVGVLARGWDAGVFPPRLTEPEADKQPSACGHCEMISACLQGDTGMRQRQRDWAERARGADVEALAPLEARTLDVWDLQSKQPPAPVALAGAARAEGEA